MKRFWLVLVIIFNLFFTTGCTTQPVNTEMQTTINTLQEKVSELELKIIMLEGNLSNVAYLDPTSEGYSNSGDFLVLISEVEEYLDGVKVYLTIGNPNYAKYSGVTIKARYGTKFDFSSTDSSYTIWKESLKEKDTQLSSELNEGAWNEVEIILPSISPVDFSYLEIEVLTGSVSLRK
jgi:hypothetical protein